MRSSRWAAETPRPHAAENSAGGGRGRLPGGWLVNTRPSGLCTTNSPSGLTSADQPLRCKRVWWRRHNNTQLDGEVGPPSSVWTTWCTSAQAAGRSQPGNRQRRSLTTRALESAADADGIVYPARGWTELTVTPERGVRVVDALLTGWHEPTASHLTLLEAVGGRPLLERSYAAALARGYRWHEFGDLHLMLP
ncbi:MAG: S-adenosylmethionine:tRNA ribosyltransferase-isomerase [Actinobacteria bacterium]|nr:S-adenosylmethionine:tRNA ribosyltransferase-isomerase [Actinomycetota bacterium]